MAVPTDVPDLEARVVAGLAERLKGNQFLKEGDLQKALAAYHNTILQLKGYFPTYSYCLYTHSLALLGLDNSIQSFFGGLGGPAPTSGQFLLQPPAQVTSSYLAYPNMNQMQRAKTRMPKRKRKLNRRN